MSLPNNRFQDIKVQIEACKRIISDKQALTDEFKEALNDKDKHYVSAMKDMTNHIDELIRQMKRQFDDMRSSYGSQLNNIESEFERERAALLQRNEDEIKQLFGLHRQTEEYYQQQRQADEEE